MRKFYLPFLLLYSFIINCQDIIKLNDSSTISGKIVKITQHFIKYSSANDPNIFRKLKKRTVAEVLFRNGDVLIFSSNSTTYTNSSPVFRIKEKSIASRKLGQYMKLSFEAGILFNSSLANIPSDQSRNINYNTSVKTTFDKSSNDYKTGFNIGFNFLIGSNPFIKYSMGETVTKTNADYYLIKNETISNANKTSTTFLKVRSEEYFVTLYNGLRFRLSRNLFLETGLAINIPVAYHAKINGYTNTEEAGSQATIYYVKDSISKISTSYTHIAFQPKVIYQFTNKLKYVAVFATRNRNVSTKYSWWIIGITYFPFKRLR